MVEVEYSEITITLKGNKDLFALKKLCLSANQVLREQFKKFVKEEKTQEKVRKKFNQFLADECLVSDVLINISGKNACDSIFTELHDAIQLLPEA